MLGANKLSNQLCRCTKKIKMWWKRIPVCRAAYKCVYKKNTILMNSLVCVLVSRLKKHYFSSNSYIQLFFPPAGLIRKVSRHFAEWIGKLARAVYTRYINTWIKSNFWLLLAALITFPHLIEFELLLARVRAKSDQQRQRELQLVSFFSSFIHVYYYVVAMFSYARLDGIVQRSSSSSSY